MSDTSYLRNFDDVEAASSPVTFTSAWYEGQNSEESPSATPVAPFFRGFAIGLALMVPAWAAVIWVVLFR